MTRFLAFASLLALLVLAGCGGGDDDDGGGGSGGAGSGGTTTTANTASIELPAELGSFTDLIDVTKSKSPTAQQIAGQQKRLDNTERLTKEAYSAAFGGAASAFRQYADETLKQTPAVIAVRAEAPGITFGPVNDPADLRLQNNQNEIEKVGDVECMVFSLPTVRGQPVDPSSRRPNQCQRVGSGVTVFVYGGGFQGPEGIAAMAKLTDDAFAAVT